MFSPCKEGRDMPRIYPAVGPSHTKQVGPTEAKAPSPKKPPKAPGDDKDKKQAGGGGK